MSELIEKYSSYVLIGDSQLLRFMQQVFNLSRKNNGLLNPAQLCISGQLTSQLVCNIQKSNLSSYNKFIVLIGTNDIISKYSMNLVLWEEMKSNIDFIIEYLGIAKILLITIPPVPLLNNKQYLMKLRNYNNHLKKKEEESNGRIRVVDLFSKCMLNDRNIDESLFERCYYDGREDKIHLNLKGLRLLDEIIRMRMWKEEIPTVEKNEKREKPYSLRIARIKNTKFTLKRINNLKERMKNNGLKPDLNQQRLLQKEPQLLSELKELLNL